MGFDAAGALNTTAEWLCSSTLVRGFVGNALFMALFATALVAVIVLSVYYVQVKSAGRTRMVRVVLYMLIALTGVFALHHYTVTRCTRTTDIAAAGLVHRVATGGAGGAVVPALGRPAVSTLAQTPAFTAPASLPASASLSAQNFTGGVVPQYAAQRADNLQLQPVVVPSF